MSITWNDLKNYINSQSDDFLASEVRVYNFEDGTEYDAGVTELLFGEDKDEEGWVPYLTINDEQKEESNG
jgi:hypothetical protein